MYTTTDMAKKHFLKIKPWIPHVIPWWKFKF